MWCLHALRRDIADLADHTQVPARRPPPLKNAKQEIRTYFTLHEPYNREQRLHKTRQENRAALCRSNNM
jgi:hypothetical protein